MRRNYLFKAFSVFSFITALGLLSLVACGGEVVVAVEGCERCKERCVQDKHGKGSCVSCLVDKHCNSDGKGSKKCIEQKCICGADNDCPNGLFCLGEKGCKACKTNDDCKAKDKSRPICSPIYECSQCQPGNSRACAPKGAKVCVQGVQACAGGFWGTCKEYVICQNDQRCVKGKCKATCPTPAPCKKNEKQCSSAPEKMPGSYNECVPNEDGCYIWGKKDRFCKKKEICENEQCTPYKCPSAQCKENVTRCAGNEHYQNCGRDKNNCIVWIAKKESCAVGKTCLQDKGKCTICKPKSIKNCYSGKAGTKSKGVCVGGRQMCNEDGTGYGACKGEVVPKNESCNDLDDDCDGKIDNGFPTKGDKCGVGTGECKNTSAVFVCKKNGIGVECAGKPLAKKPEICDGKDNDCDGKVDNIKGKTTPIRQKCYAAAPKTKGVGLCKEGFQLCKLGVWGKCEGEVQPIKERCDGKDNDCDGQIDEDFNNLKKSCSMGKGECAAKGRYACKSDGSGEECDAQTDKPKPEKCDGKDNDCDGRADEDFKNLKKSCQVGKGECLNSGSIVCKRDASGEECSVKPKTSARELCDGKDNDCDGRTDEDFKDLGKTCRAGSGNCIKKGKYVCKTNGFGSVCNVKAGQPTKEICDGADNDCDGKVDNGLPLVKYYPDHDNDGFGRKGSTAVQKCAQQAPAKHVNNDQDCNDNDSKIKPNVKDICDGIDNNCNARIDENSTHYSWYKDNDKDSYGGGAKAFSGCIKSAGTVCIRKNTCRSSLGYVNNNRDCCDSDANAKPGQSRYFSKKNNCGSFDYNCDRKASPNIGLCSCSRTVPYTYKGYADRYCNSWVRWTTFGKNTTYRSSSCEMSLSITLQPSGNASCTASCSDKKCVLGACRRASCRKTRTISYATLRRIWTPKAYNGTRLIMWHKKNYRNGCAYRKSGTTPVCGESAYRSGALQKVPNASYSNSSVSRATVSCSDSSWPAKCSSSRTQNARYSYQFSLHKDYRFTISDNSRVTVLCH